MRNKDRLAILYALLETMNCRWPLNPKAMQHKYKWYWFLKPELQREVDDMRTAQDALPWDESTAQYLGLRKEFDALRQEIEGAIRQRQRRAVPKGRSLRRQRVVQATPKWANRREIQEVYDEARMFERMFGTKFHVDHIIPLCGKTVSGLHIAENLQVLEASTNLRKSNIFTGD